MRYPVTVFFALAYAGLIACIVPFLLATRGYLPEAFQLFGMAAKFTPSIAGLVVVAWMFGTRGVERVLGRLLEWRFPPRWWLGCLLGPPLLLLAATLIENTIQRDLVPPDLDGLWLILPRLARHVFLGGGLGEELGWRGLAQPLLQRRFGALESSLIIGVVWSGWHLPGVMTDPSLGKLVGFIPFTIAVTAGAVLFGWVYNSTGGALGPVVLLHAAVNTSSWAIERAFGAEQDGLMGESIFAGLLVLLATVVTCVYGPAHLSRGRRVECIAPEDRPSTEAEA